MNKEQLAELTNAIKIIQSAETSEKDADGRYIPSIILSVMNHGVQINMSRLDELTYNIYQWQFAKEYPSTITLERTAYEYETFINGVRFFFITYKAIPENVEDLNELT